MPWIAGLRARNLRHLAGLRVDLQIGNDTPRHLVLLGSSGSGKTTLLDAITDEIEAAIDGRPHPAEGIDELDRDGDKRIKLAHVGRPLRILWTSGDVAGAFTRSEAVFAYCDQPRRIELAVAKDAVAPSLAPARPRARAASLLTTHLLVHDTEMRLARNTRDHASAGQHEAWLQRSQEGLRAMLDQPQLRLTHDRGGFHLDLPDGRRWELAHLSRGLGSVVWIWGEAQVRAAAARARRDQASFEPAGVLLIDAPESDLDPRMQVNLLSALVKTFPRLQLVVATHSALLAASLEHSIIHDLDRNRTRTSEEVRREGADELLAQMIGARLAGKASSLPPPAAVGEKPVPVKAAQHDTQDDEDDAPTDPPPVKDAKKKKAKAAPKAKITAPPPATLPPPRPKSIPAPSLKAKSVPAPSLKPKSVPAPRRERKTVEGPGPWSDD